MYFGVMRFKADRAGLGCCLISVVKVKNLSKKKNVRKMDKLIT